MSDLQENQLELFDETGHEGLPPPRQTLGRVLFHMRYDQLVLVGIATLIGVAVVFACGVERGKQLVRAEVFDAATPSAVGGAVALRQEESRHTVVAGEPGHAIDVAHQHGMPAATIERAIRPAPRLRALPASLPNHEQPAVTPAIVPAGPRTTEPVTPAPSKRRYAVQVVTYSRPQLAKQELQRLRATGIPAFLVLRAGQSSVFVGPFPSINDAHEKLAELKPHYRDCFVKSL